MSPLVVVLLAAAPLPQVPTFSTGVEAVYVDVFVSDGKGPVTALTAADFELRDDDRRRPVEMVAVESLPLTSLLVLDTSGSVAGERLLRLETASRVLLHGLRPGDEAALLTFGHEIVVRVPPTSDLARLEAGLGGIKAGGSTALYDALYAGTMLTSGRGRFLLVLYTDGEDNLSWLDAQKVQRVLEESNVLVQAVGIVPPGGLPSGGLGRQRPLEPSQVRVLRHLAEVTGGRFWPAASAATLADAFAAILESMRTRYVLRFDPDGERRPGLHRLEVKLTRRKGHVQCRRGYFVGPALP